MARWRRRQSNSTKKKMASTWTTKQSIGLIILLPVLVGAISVCSHLSIALADNSAYEGKIARYIEQPSIQDSGTSITGDNSGLLKVTSSDGKASAQIDLPAPSN